MYILGVGVINELWRCIPLLNYESELLLSLLYPLLLLLLSICFGLRNWGSGVEGNRESRHLVAACVFCGAAWVGGAVALLTVPLHFKSAVIIICNLLCGYIVLICLYATKVYTFSKMSHNHVSKTPHISQTLLVSGMYGRDDGPTATLKHTIKQNNLLTIDKGK